MFFFRNKFGPGFYSIEYSRYIWSNEPNFHQIDISREKQGIPPRGTAIKEDSFLYGQFFDRQFGLNRLDEPWGQRRDDTAGILFFFPPFSLSFFRTDPAVHTNGEKQWRGDGGGSSTNKRGMILGRQRARARGVGGWFN